MDSRPIGLFDSGFGGLTVARAVISALPEEDIVYFGDTGRYPYGPRNLLEVRGFAHQIAQLLLEHWNVKAIVVACNTAAAAALGSLQRELGVPVLGVIDPGARAAVKASLSRRVGVIGTVGTIGSGAYQEAISRAGRVETCCIACPGFVEFVEKGETDSEQVHVLAQRLLAPVIDADVDTLLLGCTHYPFLSNTIADVMGPTVKLVSSADETAAELSQMVGQGVIAPGNKTAGTHVWVSSGDVETFKRLGGQLLGPEVELVVGYRWATGQFYDHP